MKSRFFFGVLLAGVLAGCAAGDDPTGAPPPGAQVVLLNGDNFEREVYQADVPVLVDFTATWCVPCKEVDPIVESLAPEMAGRAKIGKLDIDESPGIYRGLGVNGVPHVLFFRDGEEQDRIAGVQSRETYVDYIEAMIAGKSAFDASLSFLDDDAFRRHFVVSRPVEDLERALPDRPNLLVEPFENGQTPLSLILISPSIGRTPRSNSRWRTTRRSPRPTLPASAAARTCRPHSPTIRKPPAGRIRTARRPSGSR